MPPRRALCSGVGRTAARITAAHILAAFTACGPPESAREPHRLRLEPAGRFGSADSALSLQTIGSMTLTQGRGDTLLITQFRVQAVLMLSAAGDSLGMIGRAGSGPGEFAAPFAPSILSDTIWIPDLSGSILRFDAAGRFIDQLRIPIAPLGPFQYAPSMVAALADGTLLFHGNSNPVGREAKEAVKALAFVRADRSGALLDTLALAAVRESSYVLQLKSGRGIVGSHPAVNGDLGSVDPEGRWLVIAAQQLGNDTPFGFTLSWIGLNGDTLAKQFVETPPISTKPVKEGWIDRLSSGEGMSRGEVELAAAAVPFPEFQAPALAVFTDPDGRVWVRSAHESPDSARWRVIDRERGELGGFVLPARVKLLAARGARVWGWTTGPLDEAIIVQFRVTW
jgi:hypothetical protein